MPSEEHTARTTRWDYVKDIFIKSPPKFKDWAKYNALAIISIVVVLPLTTASVVGIVLLDIPMWLEVPSTVVAILTGVALTVGLIIAEVSWKVDREFGHHDE